MKWKWLIALAAASGLAVSAGAWDYEGHHVVNELALASLPRDFGLELTPAEKSRIEFLAGEPDRWRNVPDLPLEHVNGPDHYLDLEDLPLYGLTPATLPPLRYDFVADIVKARAAHPERFPPIDPAQDADHTRELSGFLPWAICEQYEKLKSDFTVLKVLQRYGSTPQEIADARADCVYVMGVLGHYVGDGSQPLHTTVHHHGWVGNNPRGYTTRRSFHAWIDGGYFKKIGGVRAGPLRAKIRPARRIAHADDPEAFFRGIVNYLVAQNKRVVPLYQLEKDGKLSGEGPQGLEGRAFLENQLVTGAQMLGDIWLTAWLESADDDPYLERELQQRNETVVPR